MLEGGEKGGNAAAGRRATHALVYNATILRRTLRRCPPSRATLRAAAPPRVRARELVGRARAHPQRPGCRSRRSLHAVLPPRANHVQISFLCWSSAAWRHSSSGPAATSGGGTRPRTAGRDGVQMARQSMALRSMALRTWKRMTSMMAMDTTVIARPPCARAQR